MRRNNVSAPRNRRQLSGTVSEWQVWKTRLFRRPRLDFSARPSPNAFALSWRVKPRRVGQRLARHRALQGYRRPRRRPSTSAACRHPIKLDVTATGRRSGPDNRPMTPARIVIGLQRDPDSVEWTRRGRTVTGLETRDTGCLWTFPDDDETRTRARRDGDWRRIRRVHTSLPRRRHY